MWVNRFETLKIKDVLNSELAVLHTDGLKVYDATIALYNKDKRLQNVIYCYDFEGVEHISFAFLNASIGKLYLDGQYVTRFENISDSTDKKIQQVLETARKTQWGTLNYIK